MEVELISIGSELTSGKVVNTNASFMTGILENNGIKTLRITTIGDEKDFIVKALKECLPSTKAVIVTGGLGPTPDDITRNAVSCAFDRKLIRNLKAMEAMKKWYHKWGMEPEEIDFAQAYFPRGSKLLSNPIGVFGFYLEDMGRLYFFIPGVPQEMELLIKGKIIPLLKKRMPLKVVDFRTYKIFGLTESRIANKLKDLENNLKDIRFSYLPKFPEIHLVVSGEGENKKKVKINLDSVEKKIESILGNYIFSKKGLSIQEEVGRLLLKNNATVSIAESCTGGLVGHLLTEVPGSSQYFERGVIVYSNQAKNDILGISPEIIKEFGAVSKQTVEVMALNARIHANTTLGLALTGIAGPSGGTEKKPVGTVYTCLSDPEGIKTRKFLFPGNRKIIKELAAHTALDQVRRYFLK